MSNNSNLIIVIIENNSNSSSNSNNNSNNGKSKLGFRVLGLDFNNDTIGNNGTNGNNPYITPIYYSSFHFLFHYPYTTSLYNPQYNPNGQTINKSENSSIIVSWGYIGIMEKNMETTIVHWDSSNKGENSNRGE